MLSNTSNFCFQFPWVLDMEPFTAEGMARRDKELMNGTLDSDSDSDNRDETTPREMAVSIQPCPKQINYELVGVVVHSGQANAGHYYSFIKERRLVLYSRLFTWNATTYFLWKNKKELECGQLQISLGTLRTKGNLYLWLCSFPGNFRSFSSQSKYNYNIYEL